MQADAVKQLGLVSRQQCRQACRFSSIGVFGVGRPSFHARNRLQHGHALQHGRHVLQRRGRRQAIEAQHIHSFDHRPAIALRQRIHQPEHIAAVHAAQHLAHSCFFDLSTTKSNGLIGQGQRIAHRATRRLCQQAQCLGFSRHVLGLQHLHKMLPHGFRRHGTQVELQAAAEHRDRHLLRVGRSQNKFQVLGRLLQRFQHGIESGVGQHVHLIDHEDLEAPLHRLVHRLLQQALHLVHTPIGSRIQLGVIHKAAAVDVPARLALSARCGCDATLPIQPLAIERLGQDARHRGLAHAPRSREQVGMVQPLLGKCVGQGLHHVLLPHHLGEVARTVLAGEHEVRHRGDSTGCASPAGSNGTPSQRTIDPDGPPRMVKRPTGSGGEPSSPNCGASAGGKARQLLLAFTSHPSAALSWLRCLQLSSSGQAHHPHDPKTIPSWSAALPWGAEF